MPYPQQNRMGDLKHQESPDSAPVPGNPPSSHTWRNPEKALEPLGPIGDAQAPGRLSLSLSPEVSPPLTDGNVDRQHGLSHSQRPDVQAVQGFHALHRQQQVPNSREVHALGCPWGQQGWG